MQARRLRSANEVSESKITTERAHSSSRAYEPISISRAHLDYTASLSDDDSLPVAVYIPPTVSDTKQAFYENFKKPVPPVYNTVIQELLVQQHLLRYNSTYQYDEVSSQTG